MDARVPRDGRAIEEVGTYDPMVSDKSQRVTLKLDRIDHWISVGAQPSEKVAVLIEKFKKSDWGKAKAPPAMQKPKEKAAPEPEASADAGDEAPAAEESSAEVASES